MGEGMRSKRERDRIDDPEQAHYVADQEVPARDRELMDRNIAVIIEELGNEARRMKSEHTSTTPESTQVSDISAKAYELGQKFSSTELIGAKSSIVDLAAKKIEYCIIEEAIKIALDKEKGNAPE